MRTLLLSFAIVGLLCGCSSKSDYGEARGIVCDATMNTVTIVTDDNDTLSFSTVDTDKSGVDGLLLGDTAEITYRGRYEKGMGALKMVSYPQRALLGGDRDEYGCIGSAGYVWSEVLQDCIRVFEKGIRTESVRGDNRSVYIVFSPDSSQVELFFSDRQPSEILERRQCAHHGRLLQRHEDLRQRAVLCRADHHDRPWRRLRLQGKHLQHRRCRSVHRGRLLRRLYCQHLESPRSTRMDRSAAGQHDRRRPVGPASLPAARLSPREYRHCDDHDELHRHVSCELSHQDRPDL